MTLAKARCAPSGSSTKAAASPAVVAELFLRRHRQIVVGMTNRFDEQRLLRLAWHQGRPRFPALFPTAARIEREPAFDFLFVRMTLVTACGEQRLHFRLEERHRL